MDDLEVIYVEIPREELELKYSELIKKLLEIDEKIRHRELSAEQKEAA